MKTKIKNMVSGILSFISGLIPKKKNLWIFGAWEGKIYADNSKYMFEYIIKNHSEIDAVWMTKNQTVVQELREKGYKCYHKWSFMGVLYALRAEVAFETEGKGDVSSFLNGTKIVQLWHGMGAKAMKWKNKDGEDLFSKKPEKGFHDAYWMSTSNLYTDTISKLLGVGKEQFYLTGYPRNDTFIYKPRNEYMEQLKENFANCKFIMYMPTHRNFGSEGNAMINLQKLQYVDKELKKNNIIMVYKPHIHELANFLSYESTFSNIILAKEQKIWADVYSYLHYFDLLISDYSSVLTDFMCSNKPVVIFAYDIEDYIKDDAGLNDYFWDLPGGPLCYSWEEVLTEVKQLLSEDNWYVERNHCRKEYHLYNDGKNCERVYNTVMKLRD